MRFQDLARPFIAVAAAAAFISGCGGGGLGALPPVNSSAYEVQNLGTIGGCPNSSASCVTSGGRVFGQASGGSGATGWVREPDGTIRILPALDLEVESVNETGMAVGYKLYNGYIANCETGAVQQLEEIDSGFCDAYSINDQGVVVGESGGQPVVWDTSGHAAKLQVPADMSGGKALCVNNSGSAVGYVQSSRGYQEAVLWNPDGTINRKLNDGIAYKSTQAVLINDAGWVAVQCFVPLAGGDPYDPYVLLAPDGRIVTLQKAGYTTSKAVAINSSGQVVGYLTNGANSRPERAVLWSPTGSATALPLPAGRVTAQASGISDSGMIAGSAQDVNGASRAVIWTPAK